MTMRDLFGDDQQLVAGSLRGYRCWSSVTKAGELRSIGVTHTWKPKPYESPELAVCRGGQCGGPSPGEKCTCGIYGWYDPADHRLATSSIFGVVAATGRVQLGTHGFRAERVQVIAVATIYGYLREVLNDHGYRTFETAEELILTYPPHDVSGFVKHRCKGDRCAEDMMSRSSLGVSLRRVLGGPFGTAGAASAMTGLAQKFTEHRTSLAKAMAQLADQKAQQEHGGQ